MTPELPEYPSLEHLKKQAKVLLRSHKAGKESCCEVLQHLQRFKDADEATILAAEVPLKEVQFALAMEYGCKTWQELRDRVSGREAGVIAPVRREGEKVWLEGVPHFPPQKDCGWLRFFGAIGAAMRFLGERVNYAYLCGISGAAFRLKVAPDWCASAQSPQTTLAYLAQALKAMGYTNRAFFPGAPDAEVFLAIRQHIDKGIPAVVTGDLEGHRVPDDSSVIMGYDGTKAFSFISYWGKPEGHVEAPCDHFSGEMRVVDLIEKAGKALSATEAACGGFEMAMAHSDMTDEHGHLHGLAAYDSWIRRMEEMEDAYLKMDEDALAKHWWGAAMNCEGLVDARGAAQRYVRRMGEELPAPAAELFSPVLAHYETTRAEAFNTWHWFPFPHWVNMAEEGRIWTPAGGHDGTTWSPEIRKQGVAALKKMRALDAKGYEMMAEFNNQISKGGI